MPFIKVTQPFKFAHEGIHVQEFEPGDESVEVTDECAAIAVEHHGAKRVKSAAEQEADRTAAAEAKAAAKAAEKAAAEKAAAEKAAAEKAAAEKQPN